MFTPVFGVEGAWSDHWSFTMLELGRAGAPFAPLLIVGAVAILALTLLPDRPDPAGSTPPPMLIGRCLIALALAEVIGVVLVLSIGFALAQSIYGSTGYTKNYTYHELRDEFPIRTTTEYHFGLLLLAVGMVLILVGAFDRWRKAATSAE
ncbi:hypothetical protein VMT65_06815 [Nocardia sp. CDC153]|uniref:hypothetical protein n=1 Tax=Nocardia sp. CDC153 TaxID=3112167 RepID=UPI002DB90D16|nr:hypothetical protein [Nocardia sp. CDC153]MEC3952737.1 hypothetical protein [Nocardia sp. CDC153]